MHVHFIFSHVSYYIILLEEILKKSGILYTHISGSCGVCCLALKIKNKSIRLEYQQSCIQDDIFVGL
jgi:hypothetical protein